MKAVQVNEAWTKCAQNLCDAPDFSGVHILFCWKKPLDLQVFSRIGKATKRLQWTPKTIMNTSLLECFDNVYIIDVIMDWETIACVKTGHSQSSSNIRDGMQVKMESF